MSLVTVDEMIFDGTPAEFGSAAELFLQTDEARSTRIHLWVQQPYVPGARAANLWDLPRAARSPDQTLIEVRFTRLAEIIDGKRGPSGVGTAIVHAAKTKLGSRLLVSANDDEWPALESIWIMLVNYLRKIGWSIDTPEQAGQEQKLSVLTTPSGGTMVGGNVKTDGGDFVGRDQYNYNITQNFPNSLDDAINVDETGESG